MADTSPITDISELLPYRQYMDLEQLERYGQYILGSVPDKPFTRDELNDLYNRRNSGNHPPGNTGIPPVKEGRRLLKE